MRLPRGPRWQARGMQLTLDQFSKSAPELSAEDFVDRQDARAELCQRYALPARQMRTGAVLVNHSNSGVLQIHHPEFDTAVGQAQRSQFPKLPWRVGWRLDLDDQLRSAP